MSASVPATESSILDTLTSLAGTVVAAVAEPVFQISTTLLHLAAAVPVPVLVAAAAAVLPDHLGDVQGEKAQMDSPGQQRNQVRPHEAAGHTVLLTVVVAGHTAMAAKVARPTRADTALPLLATKVWTLQV